MEREFLEDGKRVFSFDLLAQRLSRDIPEAYNVQASERLLLKRDAKTVGAMTGNENGPLPENKEATQKPRAARSIRRPQEW